MSLQRDTNHNVPIHRNTQVDEYEVHIRSQTSVFFTVNHRISPYMIVYDRVYLTCTVRKNRRIINPRRVYYLCDRARVYENAPSPSHLKIVAEIL